MFQLQMILSPQDGQTVGTINVLSTSGHRTRLIKVLETLKCVLEAEDETAKATWQLFDERRGQVRATTPQSWEAIHHQFKALFELFPHHVSLPDFVEVEGLSHSAEHISLKLNLKLSAYELCSSLTASLPN